MVLLSLLLVFLLILLLWFMYQYMLLKTELMSIKQLNDSLISEKETLCKTIEQSTNDKIILEKNYNDAVITSNRLDVERNALQRNIDVLNSQNKEQISINTALLEKIKDLTSTISSLTTENDNLKKRIEEMPQELAIQFQNLGNSILEKNSEKFTIQNEENMKNILKPLREGIKIFNDQLTVNNKNANEQNMSLRLELQKTIDLGNKMSLEAENLTKAIKGNTKIQGNWGENILEKILESSGLEKDRNYIVQASFRTDEGKLYMPDVVVNLPGNKHIIIDSKMSLNNYEQFFNAENDKEKDHQLKLHFESIKKHVDELSEKKYQSEYSVNGLDFVLMFIPIEQAYTLIIQSNQSIFEDAYKKNVVITSPSTLIPTLRIIANIWKNEKQNQNAMTIAKEAGALYDKFVAFIDDLKSIGKSIDNAKNDYCKATNKLHDGKGNIINRVEHIKLLGAKATKSLDDNLLELAN